MNDIQFRVLQKELTQYNSTLEDVKSSVNEVREYTHGLEVHQGQIEEHLKFTDKKVAENEKKLDNCITKRDLFWLAIGIAGASSGLTAAAIKLLGG